MLLRRRSAAALLILVLSALAVVTGTPTPAAGKPDPGAADARGRAEHERIVAFWTKERVAQAKPRDFVYDEAAGRFVPAERAKGGTKPGTGGGDTAVGGASWTGGGLVLKTTGKVLFSMDGSYYVCSGSVAAAPADLAAGKSVALSAGHCIVDETDAGFAENWMFVPEYDTQPASLTASGSFCADTVYGCWTTAQGALLAHGGYARAGGFTTEALPYDFGFAVLGPGGHSGTADLDALLGAQAIAFDQHPGLLAGFTYAFGYPASGKYRGKDLVYCSGTTGTDPATGGQTYSLPCNMTGGSSGGPWLEPFTSSTGAGTLISVNSYGYSGSNVMYGPPLDADAKAVYDVAAGATTNTIVG